MICVFLWGRLANGGGVSLLRPEDNTSSLASPFRSGGKHGPFRLVTLTGEPGELGIYGGLP